MALRWGGTDEAGFAGVVAQGHGSAGQEVGGRVAGVGLEARHRGVEVRDDPVPEARTGGSVGVVAGHGEGLGLFGEPGPGQLRRDVLTAGHAHGAGELGAGEHPTVFDVGARQREGGKFGKIEER